MHFRPAITAEAKPLIGLYSESGCGKTYGALLIAKGFAGDMSKVGMIETEAGRGEMYADDPVVGNYQVLPIRENFSPKAYGEGIDIAGKSGLEVLIIDSGSHEWEGAGGVLDMASKNQEAGMKGVLVWQKPKIEHQREFILKLLSTPVPLVILCMRAKYPMKQELVGGKKEWVRADYLEPKQADDILFEMMVHGWIDQQHNLHVTKFSKEIFKSIFIDGKPITVETGERLSQWAKGGMKKPGPPKAKIDLKELQKKSDKSVAEVTAWIVAKGFKTSKDLSEELLEELVKWITTPKSAPNPDELPGTHAVQCTTAGQPATLGFCRTECQRIASYRDCPDYCGAM